MTSDEPQDATPHRPYELLYPGCKKHHLRPRIRNGPDWVFNLFPWSEKRHTSYHKIFDVMTVQEIWQNLEDAWLVIFQSHEEIIVPEWRGVLCKHGERRGPLSPLKIARLQEWWHLCFGSTELIQARRLLRYMMLFMVFGEHADRSNHVYVNEQLTRLLHDLPATGDRAWAFRQCFHALPHRIPLRNIKKIIRSIRAHARRIPIR